MLDIDDLSEQLQDELDANASAPLVDSRTVPTRFSLLKKMAQSPAHYHHACQSPQDESLATKLAALSNERSKDRSVALRFGTAVHEFLLGDALKVGRFSTRRAGKAWEAFQEESALAGRKVILNDREWKQAQDVADAIRRHETAMALLSDSTIIETRIDWTFNGKACRSTPDAHRPGSHVVDLKTTVSAEPETFTRQALKMHYHAQAWLYCEAIEAAGFERPSEALVIAVEKSAPMPVTILRFTEAALEVGEKLCRTWIERLMVCEATNEWPGYLSAIGDLDVWRPDELDLEFGGERLTL